MRPLARRLLVTTAVLAALLVLGCGAGGWAIWAMLVGGGAKPPARPVPVEVAAIETGPIARRRSFSGTLEASARYVVSSRVGGRIERLAVDLGDPVARDQVVVELDDATTQQEVLAARAELAVAAANRTQAEHALEVASTELGRSQTLHAQGAIAQSRLDAAQLAQRTAEADLAVARGEVARSAARLEAARLELADTRLEAHWLGGSDRRVVAERRVRAGDTVAAGAPILTLVDLDPIVGVVHVTEKDYSHLEPGQPVSLGTDAFPGERFGGEVARVAPMFDDRSRQARVELSFPNGEQRLKPGMFVEVTVVLEEVPDAVLVPAEAVTRRDDQDGVFVVDEAGTAAVWHPVELGIREGDRVQVRGEGLSGQVVTLGVEYLVDGAVITIPDLAGPAG